MKEENIGCYNKKFLKAFLVNGKKMKALKIVNKIKFYLKFNNFYDPYLTILYCLYKLSPNIYLYNRRFGRVVQGIPVSIREKKKIVFAVKWLVKSLRTKTKGLLPIEDIIKVISSVFSFSGPAIQKKIDYYLIAFKNRYLLKYLR